jgi:inorganic triphosphatase YgiF
MTAPGAAEIELKLGLSPASANALLRHPAVVAARRAPLRRARVVSTYFDTPDRALAEAGIALRVRRDGRRWVQTIKGPPLPEAGGALHSRREDEWPLPGPAVDPARFVETPWRKLLEKSWRSGTLSARYTTDIVRRTLPLELADGSFASLCIDHGAIVAGRRRVPIAEVELELEAGVPLALFDFARVLAADLPFVVGLRNKAERGDDLARRKPALGAPQRASLLAVEALPPGIDAGTALARVAAGCVAQIAGNATGLCSDTDPEWIHQMRVGTRRLRACLALAAQLGDDARVAALAAEAKALAAALGAARDLDVLATETLPALAARLADDAGLAEALARLARRVAQRRREARAAARTAVASRRFVGFVLDAGAWISAPNAQIAPNAQNADAVAVAPPTDARAFAAATLERRHRRVAKSLRHLAGRSTAELHALRIAAKKLRYAAEFFGPMFESAAARRYAKALAALQGALGSINDAATVARLARELAGDDALIQGVLQGYAAAQSLHAAAILAAPARRFAGAKRFWRRD